MFISTGNRALIATVEMTESMAKQGNTIATSSSDNAASFFRDELDKYARLVKNLA